MPKKLISVLILLTFFPSVAMGLPAGGKVAGGVANINQPKGQTLSINQLTERTIINWKGFNIDVNELVRFAQPSSKSIVLNRVTGVDPSSILGRLAANGRLFIVNPNGILFGPNSRVDVAGLLATTLNINDNDFLAGKYNFSQDPNKALSYVINKGEIKIADNGFVFLVAPGVVNEGLMIANLGKAVMASGQKLAVDFMGDGLITFAIEGKVLDRVLGPDGTPLTSAVNNSGTIRADGGQVVLTAKASSEIFSSVVNNSGVIEARSLVNHGGVIRLEGSDPVANTGQIGWQNNLGKVQNAEGAVINTGKVDVSAAERGAAPGRVTLSGQMVGSSGTILARGADGSQGGRVLITSTDKTVLTSDSQIDTSGVNNSSAGKIVVWSDNDTVFRGTIVAKGGERGGNGGQIEVSGHQNLSFTGQVNALAPAGTTGSLLLDPRNITVATGGVATLPQVDQFSDTPGVDQTIAPATINAAAANVVLQANNDITVTNAIAMTNAGVGITMQAGRDINVNASVSTSNGNISLTANDSSAIAANRSAGTGDITFGAAGNLSAGTGNIALTVGSSAAAPFNPGSINTVRNLTTTGGNIAINSPNNVSLSGTVNSGSAAVTINANTDAAGAQGFTMNAGSSIATTGGAVGININAAGGGTGAASLRNISTGGGSLTVQTNTGGNTTGGAITQPAGTTLNVGTANLSTGNGAITLNNATNDFGTVAVSRATNVSFQDANAINLGASTVPGTLNVTATGAITDGGNLSVTGTTTLAAGAGNDITLDSAANNFSTVAIASGRNVTLVDSNALNLGASTVSGTLNVTTAGAITDSGNLTVTGATTLAAGAGNDITLNNANNFSTVSITSGRNVTLNDTNALALGASTVSGTLGVTTAGAITDSGNLSVIGTTTLAAGAGNDITLDSAGNNFSTVAITSGRNVTLVDSNVLNLGASTISGTLNATTAGAITDSGNLTVTGTTTLAAGAGNDITLDSAGNNFSTVAITSGRNVTLVDSNALNLGASTISGTLNATTAGAITDSGNLNVTGMTTLAAGASNDITLNNANNFSTVAVSNGRNVTLNDMNALDLGAFTVSGTLNVTTAGAITDSGNLNVPGTTTLAAGAGNDITLDSAGNNFSTVAIASGRNVTLNDTNALVLGASTVSGTMNITTAGAITQSSGLNVSGGTTLAAGAANNITLNNATNNFSTVGVTSGNNVSLVDANAVDLGASTIGGTLNVTAAGAITDGGNLSVTGTTTLAAGAGNDITLDSAGNNFSTVAITSGRNVTLVDSNAVNLGTSTVSGALSLTTGGAITDSGNVVVTGTTTLAAGAANNITLDSVGNNFSTIAITSGNNVTLRDTNALDLAASTISGNLNVTTVGAMTDSGNLNVTGTASLAAGAGNDIILDSAGNNYSTMAITSGRNVTLVDRDALNLGTSTISGTLNVTTAGAITDSGNLNVTGTTTLAAGAGNDITLGSAGNNFSTVSVASGNNVTLRDTNALVLGASTISGTLNVTTSGALTDSGNLVVSGTTILAAGSGNDITLNSAGNNFSTLGITSGRNITLVDGNALDLGTSSVSGNFVLTTGGAVTQSGALSVVGTTSFTASAANTDILLDTQANNFAGALSFGGPLANFRDIGLRNTNPGATVSTLSGLTNLRNLTLSFDSAPVNLPTLTANGTLNVTAGGAITDSGNVVATGTTTLAAGAANDITLDSAGNNFGTVAVNSGNNVALRDANALDLGTSNVSGNLNVTAAGVITDSGNVVVAGITTLAAGSGSDITLDSAGNNFSTVGVTSGRNVTLADANALDLGTSTVLGTLNVTTSGALTQSGPLNVTGDTTLSAGAANNITLDNAANDFSTVAVTTGNNATLSDTNGLNLGASVVSGTLNVTTGGPVTQSGPLVVTGATILTAGSGNDITLTNAANNFSSVAVTSANNVTLTDANVLDLGGSTVSGTLNVTTNGALSQSGPLTVTGTTTLAAGSANDITLTNASNDFNTVAVISGRNVALTDANALDLGASTVPGTLNVTTNGALTQSGALNVSGPTILSAGAAHDITLNNASNNFSTVAVNGANNVTLADANALDLAGSTVSGTLNITTNGVLTQSGTLTVAGPTTLAAGSGNDITLNNAGNDFSTVTVTNGNNVSLRDANNISLGTSTVAGNFSVAAGGAIVDGDETGINITANSTSLTAATHVGSAANPLETAVGTLNATSNGGGIYIAEADGLTVNSVVANGGNVTISNSTGDVVINAISATGGIDLLAAGGSIFDGNGAATNLTAVADSNLRALGGVIGLSTDPIEVNINPGLLGVAATGQIGGVSVHINGTVSPTNTLTLLNSPPGEVIFNSQSANPPPINLPNLISIAAELNSYRVNENDYFTDLLLDVLGDDFFKAQSFQCEMDDSLRQKLAADLCHNGDLD